MADVRQVKITGDAADHFHKRKGTRKSKAKAQDGGDSPPGQSIVAPTNVNSARRMMNGVKLFKGGAAVPAPMPSTNPPDPHALRVPAVNASLKVGGMPPGNPTPPPLPPKTPLTQTPQTGGKLVLAPKKKSRVVLAPPKSRKGVHQTRKIRVQLSGLKKRLTKAKKIHSDSREKPIAEVRKLLEEAKLVKPAKDGKTVPDSVLRDIYKDYLLLRNRAL
jgi:hypothetical protein